jgi:hypothetical protein
MSPVVASMICVDERSLPLIIDMVMGISSARNVRDGIPHPTALLTSTVKTRGSTQAMEPHAKASGVQSH